MSDRVPIYTSDLRDLRWLEVVAGSAVPATFRSRNGIRLEDGLIVVPELELSSAVIEVEAAAPGPSYPGIAFRVKDKDGFELAYAAPHSSGQWDALQYDPFFGGSNTWQIHHGPSFQTKASVPTGAWFAMRLEFKGDKARFSIGDQPPLVVPHLARRDGSGRVGLWTYRPAYFAELRIYEGGEIDSKAAQPSPSPPPGTVAEWLAQGHGVVSCEPNGILLLNRYFDASHSEATLSREFSLEHEAEVELGFGFSDHLVLEIDGEEVCSGSHTFRPSSDRAGRGYIRHGAHKISRRMSAGEHEIRVHIRKTEPFGWGLALSIAAEGLSLLPSSPR